MPRSFKKVLRLERKTIFCYGEGATECAFLNFLKSNFVERGSNLYVKIEDAGGKNPDYIIRSCIRRTQNYAFDLKFILLDGDKEISEELKKLAKDHNIKLVISKPCIEALFLSVLEPKCKKGSSVQYKRYFERKYLDSKKKLDAGSYSDIFSKDILKKAGKRNGQFCTIINLIKGISIK